VNQTATNAFVALVKAVSGATHVYPAGDVPQGATLPYLVFETESTQHQGITHSNMPLSHSSPTVAVTVAAESRSGVITLAEGVGTALRGASVLSGKIRSISQVGTAEQREYIEGREKPIFERILRFNVVQIN